MYVWATNKSKEPGATDYYRIKIPLLWLEKLGYAFSYEDRGIGGEDDVAAMFTADINLFYGTSGQETLHHIETIKQMKPSTIQDGSIHYPPTCIMDFDDNPDYVHPFNQTFVTNGVRHYPSGDFLEPDEILEYVDHKGVRKTLWEDKVSTGLMGRSIFDVARNLQTMKIRWEAIRAAVGLTVPSPQLASYAREVLKQPNVYVFPNTIVPEDYEDFPLMPVAGDEVRILWQGGMSHYIDWYPLKDAIREVMLKYPNAKLVIWGDKFDWITDAIPENQLEFHKWSPYPAYKLKRRLLRIDINLCPLANNPFNVCKSAIKHYEAVVGAHPEATLAADVATYREIVDGETGLLYKSPEDFAFKLGRLIEDAQLRARLGQEAKRWVLDNRTPEKTIPGLFEFYQDCRNMTKGKKIITPGLARMRGVTV